MVIIDRVVVIKRVVVIDTVVVSDRVVIIHWVVVINRMVVVNRLFVELVSRRSTVTMLKIKPLWVIANKVVYNLDLSFSFNGTK